MRIFTSVILFLSLSIIPFHAENKCANHRIINIEYQHWERRMRIVFDAICIVESNNVESSYNRKENAVGVAQFRPIAIVEINRLYKANFKHSMAYDREWSWVFFLMTQSVYNKNGDYERAARVHNGGGQGWYVTATNPYWEKVDSVLKTNKMIIK
jgi:hypothetical protein